MQHGDFSLYDYISFHIFYIWNKKFKYLIYNKQCAAYCVKTTMFVCRSFSYKKGQRECFLSAGNMLTETDPEIMQSSEMYDYYELSSQTCKYQYV